MGTLPTVFCTNRAWKNCLSERPLLVSQCIGLGCRGDGDQENTGTNSETVKPFVSQPACQRLRVIQQDRVPKRPVGRWEIAVLHRKGRQSIPSSGKNNETYRLWWGGSCGDPLGSSGELWLALHRKRTSAGEVASGGELWGPFGSFAEL